MKICSLLPGATEVVAALGQADCLVGISHECDYPPEVKNRPVMVRALLDPERGSSRQIDGQVRDAVQTGRRLYELVESLFVRAQPDLVITQDLCHVCAVTPDQLERAIGALRAQPRLLSLNPTRIEDVLHDVEQIGSAIGRDAEGHALASDLRARLLSLKERVASSEARPNVVCLEWVDPFYAAGHWVPEMVAFAGGYDPLGSPGLPSQHITWEQIQASAPEVLVFMPCGFSLDRTLRELDSLSMPPGLENLPAVRNGAVYAVDASSYFSRPGPRLVEGVAILAAVCHPSAFGNALPLGVRHVTLHDHGSHLTATQ